MNNNLKIAAAHSFNEPLNWQNNIEEIATLVLAMEKKGVQFALFPELSVSGYLNAQNQLKQWKKIQKPALNELITLSKQSNLCFSVGLPLPLFKGFGIAQIMLYQGEIIHTHFKTHLSVHEAKNYHNGKDLNLINFMNFQMGTQLCLESHYPELSLLQQMQGANVLNFAFASPRETPDEKMERFKMLLKPRAYDNVCFVLACNSSGITPSGKSFAGVALIISPKGKVLAKSKGMNSNYCMAEICNKDITTIQNSKMSNFPAYRKFKITAEYNE